jgi:hypothetical protein
VKNGFYFIIALIVALGIGLGFSIDVSGEEALIPSWIKTTAGFWVDDKIEDKEFIQALQYLVEKDILKIPPKEKNIIDKIHEDTISPLSNMEIRNALNANPNTFSGTCSNDSGGKPHAKGKFTNGNFAIHDLSFEAVLLDAEGNVSGKVSINLYDLSPNEERYFDYFTLLSDGNWETCKFQISFIYQK